VEVVRYGSKRISFPPAVEVRWRRVRSASSFSSRKILPRHSTTRNWNINSRFDETLDSSEDHDSRGLANFSLRSRLFRERAGRRCIGLASRRVISGCGMPAADQNHCTRCRIPMPRRNLSDTKRGSAITRNCERAVMNENHYTRPQCTRRCTVAEIAGKCRSVSCDLTSNAETSFLSNRVSIKRSRQFRSNLPKFKLIGQLTETIFPTVRARVQRDVSLLIYPQLSVVCDSLNCNKITA